MFAMWPFRKKQNQGRPRTGQGAIDWLRRSGIICEGEMVTRVVIDIAIDKVVMVYKETNAGASCFDTKFPRGFEVAKNANARKPNRERISACKIKPGDTLVFYSQDDMDDVARGIWRADARRIFPGVKAILLERGMTIGAIRTEDSST